MTVYRCLNIFGEIGIYDGIRIFRQTCETLGYFPF